MPTDGGEKEEESEAWLGVSCDGHITAKSKKQKIFSKKREIYVLPIAVWYNKEFCYGGWGACGVYNFKIAKK